MFELIDTAALLTVLIGLILLFLFAAGHYCSIQQHKLNEIRQKSEEFSLKKAEYKKYLQDLVDELFEN